MKTPSIAICLVLAASMTGRSQPQSPASGMPQNSISVSFRGAEGGEESPSIFRARFLAALSRKSPLWGHSRKGGNPELDPRLRGGDEMGIFIAMGGPKAHGALGMTAFRNASQYPVGSTVEQQLDEVARVGTVMVDGDVCQKIVTAPALKAMFEANPRDRWLASDSYDVDDIAFTATKKTLIRLSRLVSFPADVNLWMPIEGHPDKIQIVIRNVHEMSQFWPWGALYQDMIPEMKTVLETGKRVTVNQKPGWVSVLAPVYNSLGDIVGLMEVATQTRFDAQANVK